MIRKMSAIVLAAGVLCAVSGVSASEGPRVSASSKGSLLIYSKVDLRWNSAGDLVQDTILEISNDYPEDVYVQFYFVNGDEPMAPVWAGDPPQMVAEGEPGWNWVDCQTALTANQPMYWSAASGSPLGCQPFDILDPDNGHGPGRLAGADGSRVLRGFVYAWAVNNAGQQIRWNHLSGSTTIINYAATTAWEYNAWAFQSKFTSQGQVVGTPGTLWLDGTYYDAPYDVLLMDFYESGSTALSGGGVTASVDTDLTLHPVSADLRQDNDGPITTKAHFDIWNQNEHRLSGTHRCITCWDQTLLSQYDAPNHFATLGTDRGKARIDGMASGLCDDPGCSVSGADERLCSQPAALLGVVAKVIEFSGPVTGRRAMAGRSLVGQGWEPATIMNDVISPPGELKNDAREAAGLLRIENSDRTRGAKGSRRGDENSSIELQGVQE